MERASLWLVNPAGIVAGGGLQLDVGGSFALGAADSIDFTDGYVGTVGPALVIHNPTDGNRCVEGDGDGDNLGLTPTTSPTIQNLTCIPSNIDEPP